MLLLARVAYGGGHRFWRVLEGPCEPLRKISPWLMLAPRHAGAQKHAKDVLLFLRRHHGWAAAPIPWAALIPHPGLGWARVGWEDVDGAGPLILGNWLLAGARRANAQPRMDGAQGAPMRPRIDDRMRANARE